MNNIFDIIIFIPISLSAFVFCYFAFILVAEAAMGMNTMKNVAVVASSVFEIFNLTYPSQLLSDSSSGIADAAYRSHWYERDVKFRKAILNIIVRSQKPCYMAPLGFSKISLVVFSRILSSGWSYLSVLNRVYQKNL